MALNVTIVSYGNFPLQKFTKEETEIKEQKKYMVLFILTERKSVRKEKEDARIKLLCFFRPRDMQKGLFIESGNSVI